MAGEDNLDKRIASVMKRFHAGEITREQAKGKLQELILAAETLRDLELAHNAYDSLEEEDSG